MSQTDLQAAADALRQLITPDSVWRAKEASEAASVGRLAFRVKYHSYPDNRVQVIYTEGGYRGYSTDLSLFDITRYFDKVG